MIQEGEAYEAKTKPPDTAYHGYRIGEDEPEMRRYILDEWKKTMPVGLEIALAPERLDEGTPEETGVLWPVHDTWLGEVDLTGGIDFFISNLPARPTGLRLPRRRVVRLELVATALASRAPARRGGWRMAHKMTSIGEGYVWPNL